MSFSPILGQRNGDNQNLLELGALFPSPSHELFVLVSTLSAELFDA